MIVIVLNPIFHAYSYNAAKISFVSAPPDFSGYKYSSYNNHNDYSFSSDSSYGRSIHGGMRRDKLCDVQQYKDLHNAPGNHDSLSSNQNVMLGIERAIQCGELIYFGKDSEAVHVLSGLRETSLLQRDLPEFYHYKDFLNGQIDAVNHTLNMPFAFKQEHYASQEIREFFQRYDYDTRILDKVFLGTYIQSYLHKECLSIFEILAQGQLVHPLYELPTVCSAIADLGWAALSYNSLGKVRRASQLVQSCLMLLDCTKVIAHKSIAALSVIGDAAYHIGCGAQQGVDNVVAVFCDPIQFLSNCAQAIKITTEGMLHAQAIGSQFSAATQIAISDPDKCVKRIEAIKKQIEPIMRSIDSGLNRIAQMPAGKVLEVGTTAVVEGMIWGAVGKLCRCTLKTIPVITQAIHDGVAIGEIAITAEGIPVRIAVPKVVECMEGTQKISNMTAQAKTISEINPTKIWSRSQSFTELNKKIEKLKQITRNSHIASLINADTSINKISIIEKEASVFYNAMRKTNIDVKKISTNTGISQKTIQQIKDHLFKENHLLRNKITRFDPDPDIANAWKRLVDGKFFRADLKLLQHEYAELLIMQGDLISYDIAHPLANSTYNWQSSLL